MLGLTPVRDVLSLGVSILISKALTWDGLKWTSLVVSCDADSHARCLTEERPMGGHVMFGKSINKTRWTVMEAELGLLIELAVQCLLVSHLH